MKRVLSAVLALSLMFAFVPNFSSPNCLPDDPGYGLC